jgi:hypothetical protein
MRATQLQDLKPGDPVVRWVAGEFPMMLTVTAVDEAIITCGAWTFDRVTGGEIDEDIGWTALRTGSVIVPGVDTSHPPPVGRIPL